ncbi:MAG: hypothetical protein JXA81_12635 [Sedimentisphaerales bacterium]|nr:hypothetical protein [Sedimentisphaerales bacterium]
MKKVSATALGKSRITAAAGIFARLTPIMQSVLIGARTRDKRTLGRSCVPVLISKPAFITDHVHTTAAAIVADRKTAFPGQR